MNAMDTKDDALIEKMSWAAKDVLPYSGRHAKMRAALSVARKATLEEAATHIDHSLCDVGADAETFTFMELRDYFAFRIRSLSEQERTP